MIIGSQFKEITVRQKFFQELPKNKSIKIYHFDIETELEDVTDFTERDYNFIPLAKDLGVKEFLQFLRDNKDRIENIQIEGTEIINSSFVKRIKEGEKISKADFFTAKQDDHCQWYGIINEFDIRRNDYEKIKNAALGCFDKATRNKVAAVVHGFGGCGKSTLLRRLAVDLCDAPFKVLWLKEREFGTFADKGLKQIQADSTRNYLVIIEDWYRNTANERAKEFLLNSQPIRNLRFIIGDRETAGKDYMDNLCEPENQFNLKPGENGKIIRDILDHFSDWKSAAEKVLKSKAVESTSLFLLLFVIARINEAEFGDKEIDFTDPSSAFRDIVKSDLKQINARYPGLAMALHIWACIYANYKIFIDFDSFLKVADAYNENSEVSNALGNWKGNSSLLSRLKSYININKKTTLKNKKLHSFDFLQFNHDKLAEDGLAQVVLEGWEFFYYPATKEYDDLLLKKFVQIVLDRGNNYFSSVLLAAMLQHHKKCFSLSEMKGYIFQLYDKENYTVHYLNHLADNEINLSETELRKYLFDLFDKKAYPYFAWLGYFKKACPEAKHEAALKILEVPDIYLLQPDIVVAAFNQKGYNVRSTEENIKSKEEIAIAKHKAAIRILTVPDITLLTHHIVIAAFNQKGYDDISEKEIATAKYDAAIKVLNAPDITLLQYDFVVAAFSQKGYDTASNKLIAVAKLNAAVRILAAPDLIMLQQGAVFAAFNQTGFDADSEKEIAQAKHEAAIKILATIEINLLQHDMVLAAFNQSGYNIESEDEIARAKHKAVMNILAIPDITSIVHHLVVAAFNQKSYDDKSEQEIAAAKHRAAIKILTIHDVQLLQHDIVVAAFYQKGYDEISEKEIATAKYRAAKMILSVSGITLLQHDIVVAAFSQKGYDDSSEEELATAKYEAAIKILENVKWNDFKNLFPVMAALKFSSSLDIYPDICHQRINEIIYSFLGDSGLKLNRDFYFGLMGIPFHKNDLWAEHCQGIISNWNEEDRRGIVRVLHCHKTMPGEIRNVCSSILTNWRDEVFIKIYQVYGKPHKCDHIKFSLGHPDLRKEAMIAATEMVKEEEQNPNTLEESLYETVLKIVKSGEFPEWKTNTENESNHPQSE